MRADTILVTAAIHLDITKLHLHAFYLFDEASTAGYVERIVALYFTACTFIEHTRTLDTQSSDFLSHCPFYCYEAFLCAAFIILKILRNNYFAAIVDTRSGQTLVNFSVSALRKMSVTNNDLPGRLSDVLAYLWTHPDASIASGRGIDGLQLKVKSRMSMSIVYDSLWRWRAQFRTEIETAQSEPLHTGNASYAFDEVYSTDFPTEADSLPEQNQALDLNFELADLNGIYSDDFHFDWLT